MAEPARTEPLITSAIDPDLERVRRFVLDRIAEGAFAALVAAILALCVRMRDLNSELMRQLAAKRRTKPPNEKLRRLQLELPLLFAPAANDTEIAPAPAKRERAPRGPKKRTPHGRPKLPAHLPRRPEVIAVQGDARNCPNCHVEAKTIGYKTREKLDIEPAHFIVVQEKRETVACPKLHDYLCTAPARDEVLDRGILGEELLVQALVDHYGDGVPWERMARNARALGVPLAANTLAASVGRVVDLLDPIVRHIAARCLASRYVALDATSMPVLDALHPLGIRTGTLWLLEGEHRYSYFAFAPSGHADHLKKLCAGHAFERVMCDGSPTHNCLQGPRTVRGGCNAHGRRKLVEALRRGDARAREGIDLYAEIFHVDAEATRARESLDERFARRQREMVPLFDRLRRWIDARKGDVEPRSVLGQAVGYLHRQWKRLTEVLREPLMELTNNEVERGLRTWVLDRKTWMFVGHDQSAQRTADVLSILTTCKKFGIDPRRYVRDTLRAILDGATELAPLLPESYAARHAAAPAAAPLAVAS